MSASSAIDDTPLTGRLLVRVEEAARLCDISRSRMYELIAAGEVPSVTIGRSRRVPLDALRTWIEAQINAGRRAA